MLSPMVSSSNACCLFVYKNHRSHRRKRIDLVVANAPNPDHSLNFKFRDTRVFIIIETLSLSQEAGCKLILNLGRPHLHNIFQSTPDICNHAVLRGEPINFSASVLNYHYSSLVPMNDADLGEGLQRRCVHVMATLQIYSAQVYICRQSRQVPHPCMAKHEHTQLQR
jgi:hypothetical protein